jgi:hypothetical protein
VIFGLEEKRVKTALLVFLSLSFLALSLAHRQHIDFGRELLAGWILSVTNAFLGYVFLERAFRLQSSMFIFVSLASLTMRFFLMAAAVAVMVMTVVHDIPEFIAGFMASYVLFMSIEIAWIYKRTARPQSSAVRIG